MHVSRSFIALTNYSIPGMMPGTRQAHKLRTRMCCQRCFTPAESSCNARMERGVWQVSAASKETRNTPSPFLSFPRCCEKHLHDVFFEHGQKDSPCETPVQIYTREPLNSKNSCSLLNNEKPLRRLRVDRNADRLQRREVHPLPFQRASCVYIHSLL